MKGFQECSERFVFEEVYFSASRQTFLQSKQPIVNVFEAAAAGLEYGVFPRGGAAQTQVQTHERRRVHHLDDDDDTARLGHYLC